MWTDVLIVSGGLASLGVFLLGVYGVARQSVRDHVATLTAELAELRQETQDCKRREVECERRYNDLEWAKNRLEYRVMTLEKKGDGV